MRGPWSSDKVALLERLNAGYGVRIDWAYSSAGEVARASLLEATISGNFHVVSLLVETLRTRPTTEIVRQAVYGLSEEHPEYRWDYDEEGERCMILEILFNSVARTEDIDWDDAEITAWAVRAKDGDDWRGRWVLRSMRYKGEVSMLAACDDPTMGPP